MSDGSNPIVTLFGQLELVPGSRLLGRDVLMGGCRQPCHANVLLFAWCIQCRQGHSPVSDVLLTLGVPGAPGFPRQLTMAECKCNLHTVSGKSISSWDPEGLLWINWQYRPSCC